MKPLQGLSGRLVFDCLVVATCACAMLSLALPWLSPFASGSSFAFIFIAFFVLLTGPPLYFRIRVVERRWRIAAGESNPGDRGRVRLAMVLTAATHVTGLAITVTGVVLQRNEANAVAAGKFEVGADRIAAEAKRRFSMPLYGLKGLRGMYASGLQVNRQAFKEHVASRDLPNEFPGARGFGFIQHIARDDLPRFIASERADGAADFRVKSVGAAPDLYVIKYIEPLAMNRDAWGFDIGQEAVRREGAERAVATGQAALTDQIALVQDGQNRPGLLYFLPVFRPGAAPQTLEQRHHNLVGLLYVPMVVEELMADVAKASTEPLAFELYGSESREANKRLFSSSATGTSASLSVVNEPPAAQPMFESVRTLAVGGQDLLMHVRTTPAFEAGVDRSSALLIGLAGALVSVLAAATMWLLLVGRLRAEMRARQMNGDLERLAKVVQHTSNSVSIMDVWQRINWVNEGFTRLSGYTLDEARGKTPGELLSSGNADPASLQALKATAVTGEACRVEVLNRAKDGHEYWVDTEIQPMRNPAGELTGFMEISSDITERRRAEAEVGKVQTLLQESIETLDEAFVLFDPQDRLVLCNQRYQDMYALGSDTLAPGTSFERILRIGTERNLYPDAIGRVDTWVAERMAAHSQQRSQVFQSQQNGRFLRVVERRMPDGHTVGLRIDITDLVEATNTAEAALASKSQFLANMSHEIRTPMNAVLGLLKILQNTAVTEEQQDYLGKTEGAARSLLMLINDILDFSKIEAGKMSLDPRVFSVDDMLRNLSVILSSNQGNKPLELLFDLDPAVPPQLVGDDMRLSQVLINLCGNAIKFTTEGEVVVHIALQERTAHEVVLKFAVRDSGIGIAPANLERIFSGFTQAEVSTTRRFGGTGLGLAISSRLVDLMGGKLRVDSEEGAGSTFHFELTVGVPAAASVSAAIPPVRGGTAVEPLRVLFAEDHAQTRKVLLKLAQVLGWQADAACSGEEAITMIQRGVASGQAYQAVFLDWSMPGMGGMRALRFMQRMPHVDAQTPLVLMGSATERETMSQRCTAEGRSLPRFVVKPVTASMLAQALTGKPKPDMLAATAVSQDMAVPAAAVAMVSAPTPTLPSAEKKDRLRGMRLLVVDDNKINQLVAKQLLSQEGAVVTLAANGQLGVDAVAQAVPAFDAVLMDLQMPVMDGFAATRAIRETLGLAQLPVIAMTANAMASDRQACLDAGMNEHVPKPFDLERLVALLLQCTGKVGAA